MDSVIKATRSTLGLLRLVGPCGCAIEVEPRKAAERDPDTMARWDALVDHLTQGTPCDPGACKRTEAHECRDDVEYCERCCGYRMPGHRCDA